MTHKEYSELNDMLEKFEIMTFVSKVAMREMSEEQVYSELENRTKTKFEAFDDMAGKCVMG